MRLMTFESPERRRASLALVVVLLLLRVVQLLAFLAGDRALSWRTIVPSRRSLSEPLRIDAFFFSVVFRTKV